MRFRIDGAIVSGNLDFLRVYDLRLSDVSSKMSYSSLFEKLVDFRRGAGSVVNMRFYLFHFHSCFPHVINEIVDLVKVVVSRFLSLPAFAARDSSLFLGDFLLFYLKDVFFFLSHGLFEQKILPIRAASSPS
ncbi:hypothetical protein YC2023_051256 [Brassica napus]